MISQFFWTESRTIKMVKTCSHLEPSPRWLGDGHQKIYILSTLAKVMEVQSQKYKKNGAKVPYFGRFGVGSRFGPLRVLKKSKSNFCSPQEPLIQRRFLVKCGPSRDFFEILVCKSLSILTWLTLPDPIFSNIMMMVGLET